MVTAHRCLGGRPSADRFWNECFAQLVGTVLSLWDAAQLDAAGENGEVIPTFINLTDASIKMVNNDEPFQPQRCANPGHQIESLPMSGNGGQSLQNVLSISTAANNRYLLHFNSLHSLTQWTAGIRLAMFELSTLQEAYTGSIIAGKGKYLNNIRTIMERSRFSTEDWARVRFGAGTPWRRCWCVITQPDEKDIAKAQKIMKKRSTYDRSVPLVRGDIKFYESRKITKKTKPIATITEAFSAYAIYPQAKPLIEQSTLVKVEGRITIHSTPESSTEGFVFVMPEVHPAVTGFEMMLRWLLPVYDTFGLYGRPARLIADVLDTKSLMFAMPNTRRYGYLELIDVAGLIHTQGSEKWTEREWRMQMKIMTSKRMSTLPMGPSRAETTASQHARHMSRSSLNLPPSRSRSSVNLTPKGGIRFGEEVARSSPGSRTGSPAASTDNLTYAGPRRVDSAPPMNGNMTFGRHQRAASDAEGYNGPVDLHMRFDDASPQPPVHAGPAPNHVAAIFNGTLEGYSDPSSREGTPDHERQMLMRGPHLQGSPQGGPQGLPLPAVNGFTPNAVPFNPVSAPPVMAHRSGQQPQNRPNQMPEMRRANTALDQDTLVQLAEVNRPSTDLDELQLQAARHAPPVPPSMGISTFSPNPAFRPRGNQGLQPPARMLPSIPGTPANEISQFNYGQPEPRLAN